MSPDDGRPPNVTALRPRARAEGPAPCNTDAEQALLGALLLSNRVWERVCEIAMPEHFSNAVHARIYAAIGALIERGQEANPVTLKRVFDQEDALTTIGGARYLARLAMAAVTLSNTEDYARVVRDLFLRRQLLNLGHDIADSACSSDLDDCAAAQIERAEQALYALGEHGGGERGAVPLAGALNKAIAGAERAFQRAGRTAGVATGFADLDAMLGGLHPSDLVVLAGRPAMGKTAIATTIAVNAARDRQERPGEGAAVGLFSLEMAAEQLAARILGAETGVASDRIRRGAVARDDFVSFVAARPRLAALPLLVDDTPALSIAALRTRARRLKRRHGLGLVIVDYLQLLTTHGKSENRVQEVGEISRGLKALAKELDLPVLALSQLSRAVEGREDKRPLLADLRESGSIEQDADAVLFVYREEYYAARGEPDIADGARHHAWADKLVRAAGIAEIIVAKNRHGPTGTVRLRFEAATTRFDNLAPQGR